MTRQASTLLVRRAVVRACAATTILVALFGCSSTRSGGSNGSGSSFGNAPVSANAGQGSGSGAGNGLTGSGGGGASCSTLGAVRSCCGSGTQTCSGQVEFASWGPCLSRVGVVLSCADTCAQSEFGCANTPRPDGGSGCAPGEFGPGCDGGGPPPPSLCSDKSINTEPEILAAYSPASGQSVGQQGEIKAWITDEAPAIIGAGEQVDPSNGLITAPGDRASTAPDGYLWEPALYIAPATAERGGQPHFPTFIRGWYNNIMPAAGMKPMKGTGIEGPAIESPPAGTVLSDKFNSEDIWEVGDLGLAPGVYQGEFVIHDGDLDRAIGCVTIVIAP